MDCKLVLNHRDGMTTVGDVVEYLSALDPKSNLPRVTFYNFLRFTQSPMAEFSFPLVREFIEKSITHHYWQAHTAQLSQTIYQDLKSLPKPVNFDLKEILKFEESQIVAINSFDNYFPILKRFESLYFQGQKKLQFIQISDKEVMVIALFDSEEIEVKVFASLAFLQDGDIKPMPPISSLKYTADLELAEGVEHWIQTDLGSTYRFSISSGMIHGYSLRMPSFTKEDVVSGKMYKNLKLLSSIKVLERYFIDPHSDPIYQSLCKDIEEAQRLLDSPVDRSRAEQTLRRAKLSYREIFPNDKLLLLLITNLEHKLNKKSGQVSWTPNHAKPNQLKATESDSTSSYPKAGSLADEKPTNL